MRIKSAFVITCAAAAGVTVALTVPADAGVQQTAYVTSSPRTQTHLSKQEIDKIRPSGIRAIHVPLGNGCTGDYSAPWKNGRTVYAEAHVLCNRIVSIEADSRLTRSRWYGEQKLDQYKEGGRDYEAYALTTWKCSGTYTYRNHAYMEGNGRHYVASPSSRISC
ncbi:hypothetical protein [Streptomyces sp. NPDC003480]